MYLGKHFANFNTEIVSIQHALYQEFKKTQRPFFDHLADL